MSTVEANPFISAPVRDLVGTSAASESPNTRDYGREDAFREAWRRIIDGRLIEWGCYPAKLADEGVDPPTAETLKLAIDLAGQLRGSGWLPQTVVLDPNGGIVFEQRKRDTAEVYHVWDDGTVEFQRYQGSRLVGRWPV